MFRFNRVACAFAVGALVSVAVAGAVRLDIDFDETRAHGATGMAILNFAPGHGTTLQLITSDLPTNTATGDALYDVRLESGGTVCGQCASCLFVDTNTNPNAPATLHYTFENDCSDAVIVINGPDCFDTVSCEIGRSITAP